MRRARITLLAMLLGVCALWACEPAPSPPPLDPVPPISDASRLHLAGDEAATPLFRHLADHFSARRPGPPVVVESPLGARGALRALEDAAIDAALVVTPHTGGAAADGEQGIPIALTRVTLVTGAASSFRQIAPDVLQGLLRGDVSPEGASRTMLLAGGDDPAQRALAQVSPALEAAFDEAVATRRWPVFFEGQALRDAVRRTPGALAVTDTGTLRMLAIPLWQVRVTPAPGYDDRLVLRLVGPGKPRPRLAEFIEFLRGPEGQALIADVGYMLP